MHAAAGWPGAAHSTGVYVLHKLKLPPLLLLLLLHDGVMKLGACCHNTAAAQQEHAVQLMYQCRAAAAPLAC